MDSSDSDARPPREDVLLGEARALLRSVAKLLAGYIAQAERLLPDLENTETYRAVDGADDAENNPLWSVAGSLREILIGEGRDYTRRLSIGAAALAEHDEFDALVDFAELVEVQLLVCKEKQHARTSTGLTSIELITATHRLALMAISSTAGEIAATSLIQEIMRTPDPAAERVRDALTKRTR